MKRMKFLTLLLSVTILSLMLAVFSSAAAVKTVYISDAGNDANDGSEAAPVANLLRAYEILGNSGGTVCAIGDFTVSGEYRNLCKEDGSTDFGPVTITSKDGKTMTIAGQGIWFPTDTVIENINIHCTYTDFNSYLVANCHKLVLGKNINVTKAEGAYGYPIVYGGGMYSFLYIDQQGTADSDVTVKSGTWEAVFAGGAANGRGWGTHIDDVLGNGNVNVTGGTINNLYAGNNGNVGGTDPVVIYGNANMKVSGGNIGKFWLGGASAWSVNMGNISVELTGGEIAAIDQFIAQDGNDMVEGEITLRCTENFRTLAEANAAKFASVEYQKSPSTADMLPGVVLLMAAALTGMVRIGKKH